VTGVVKVTTDEKTSNSNNNSNRNRDTFRIIRENTFILINLLLVEAIKYTKVFNAITNIIRLMARKSNKKKEPKEDKKESKDDPVEPVYALDEGKDALIENIMKETFAEDPDGIYEISKDELIKTLESERKYLESELMRTKNKLSGLQTELGRIKSPPLIIGQIVDLLVDGRAVVKSTTGPRFVVQVANFIEDEELDIGTRVAMNKDSLCIISILPSSKDPIIGSAEVIESPDVDFKGVGGLMAQINELKETIELPLTHPEKFAKLGIEPPIGVLLIGPPGTGKTLMAKAVAAETKATFIRLVGSELVQKYIGEGARLVRELFQLAKEKTPSIIFIDEIDAMAGRRLDSSTSADREVQRTLIQLLAELDGFDPRANIRIIAATNRPDILDPAILRPGRFDRIIRIPMPDTEGRKEIFRIHTLKMALAKNVDLGDLAEKTEGLNGAQIKSICTEAGMFALRENKTRINTSHFIQAIEKVKASKDDDWRTIIAPDKEKIDNMFL
jgi:proteasome regulatory subunit